MTVANQPYAPAREKSRCPVCAAEEREPLMHSRDRIVATDELFAVARCEHCGLAYTDPRPIDLDRYYPKESYYAYKAGRDSWLERLRLWLIASRSYAPIARREPGRLLDVGCGAGGLAASFARRGWSAAGVEPSPQGARHAAERGIEMHCGTLDDAPWADATFDAVVFNHSLEHVEDPAATLRRAHSLLRPGGMLGIAVPNFGSWQRRAFGDAWFQRDVPRHLQHWDTATLAHTVRRAGFEPIHTTTSSMLAGLLSSLQYCAFGRRIVSGRPARIAQLVTYPVLAATDLVAEGDCLNLVAVRES